MVNVDERMEISHRIEEQSAASESVATVWSAYSLVITMRIPPGMPNWLRKNWRVGNELKKAGYPLTKCAMG